jgi:hypothetical protein
MSTIVQSDITKEAAGYVGRHYKYGSDVQMSIEKLPAETISEPIGPPTNASRTQNLIWEKEGNECVKRKCQLDENLIKLYSVIWSQCTDAMKA